MARESCTYLAAIIYPEKSLITVNKLNEDREIRAEIKETFDHK